MGRLNGRVDALEHDDNEQQHASSTEWVRQLSDAELERRIALLVDLYDERGWPVDDARVGAIVVIEARAWARRAAADPSAENIAESQRWQERLARFREGGC